MRTLRDFSHRYPHWTYVLYFPVYLALYFLAETLITDHYWVSYLPLDDRIPFVDWFVIFYDLWYPAMILIGVYLLLREPENFKRYMKYLFIGFFCCEAIWFLFPNGQNLRPPVFPEENCFTWMIGNLYAADTNTNVFPSAHVVGAIAVAVAVFHADGLRHIRWLRPLTVAVCFLISISTVFIKQHSILDVFGAVVLCLILYPLFYRLPAREPRREKVPT